MQTFYCESITFKKPVNIFEHMEIAESIYEGIVEPSYEESTRSDATRAGLIMQKRGESASSHTYSKKSESSGKHRNIYVD